MHPVTEVFLTSSDGGTVWEDGVALLEEIMTLGADFESSWSGPTSNLLVLLCVCS